MTRALRITLLLTILTLVPLSEVSAAWVENGVAVSAAPGAQRSPMIVSDGAGGAIVAWSDQRDGAFDDIYLQRLDGSGNELWTHDGVAICTAAGQQSEPRIVTDGAGGAIVVWLDARGASTDIYAQRVDALGVAQWTSDGVAVCTASNTQDQLVATDDGLGGVIVAWTDRRSIITGRDIFAQRLDSSGSRLWTVNGVAMCSLANIQYYPDIVSDGMGEAIVVWQDVRSGSSYDIYAQRVNSLGNVQWTTSGVAISTAANNQDEPHLVSVSTGGAIISWHDYRAGAEWDVYAQRVNLGGTAQWTADGVAISTASSTQRWTDIASDGADGAIITWLDYRDGHYDVYAQRVSFSGSPLWTMDGVAVSTSTEAENSARIVSDGAGGAVITWTRGSVSDVYAQRIDAAGSSMWTANGAPVSIVSNSQYAPELISDGAGGVIIVFWDLHASSLDVYAQRIENRYGYWGRPEPDITSAADYATDQGGSVVLNWKASERDVLNQQLVTHYSIWRATDAVAVASMTAPGADTRFVQATDIGPDFEGSAYRVERTSTVDYYWEWMSNQYAAYAAGYSEVVATRADSVAGNPAVHYFQVIAHTFEPFTFWPSQPDSGYSVDNLAPAAPLALTAQRVVADVELDWTPSEANEEDFLEYAVYRSESSGFPTVPSYFLANTPDTLWTDTMAELTKRYYYVVCAVDIHNNLSVPSNEATVDPVLTGIGDRPPAATSLLVLPNTPNPFAANTELSFWLPSAMDVTLEVYDVAGRRVYSRQLAQMDQGWQSVFFDGRDAAGGSLPSGVYFYRVIASQMSITRKMVITR